MRDFVEIEKTNRMNDLFDCYATLLTKKQMNYMELYYADDFSLGEIAEEFGVSRQAVYDNIRRTEKILEDYERKLHIFSDYVMRNELIEEMKAHLEQEKVDPSFLLNKLNELQQLDEE